MIEMLQLYKVSDKTFETYAEAKAYEESICIKSLDYSLIQSKIDSLHNELQYQDSRLTKNLKTLKSLDKSTMSKDDFRIKRYELLVNIAYNRKRIHEYTEKLKVYKNAYYKALDHKKETTIEHD